MKKKKKKNIAVLRHANHVHKNNIAYSALTAPNVFTFATPDSIVVVTELTGLRLHAAHHNPQLGILRLAHQYSLTSNRLHAYQNSPTKLQQGTNPRDSRVHGQT